MTVSEIQKALDQILPIKSGHTIAITLFNRSTYYGYFEIFCDSHEMSQNNKWRFISINKAGEYYKELKKTKVSNALFSIIIDGDDISKLELTRLHYSGIEF